MMLEVAVEFVLAVLLLGAIVPIYRSSLESVMVEISNAISLRSRALIAVNVAFLVAVLFSGCATDVANRYYGAQRYPPRDPRQVELLRQKPNREFIVIADFQSRGESPEAMRRRAAKIGADAVIVVTVGGLYDWGEEWAGSDRQAGTYSRIIGTAIKYKDTP